MFMVNADNWNNTFLSESYTNGQNLFFWHQWCYWCLERTTGYFTVVARRLAAVAQWAPEAHMQCILVHVRFARKLCKQNCPALRNLFASTDYIHHQHLLDVPINVANSPFIS